MPSYDDIVERYGQVETFRDAIEAIRGEHQGTGRSPNAPAVRYVADTYGVNISTARRWVNQGRAPSPRTAQGRQRAASVVSGVNSRASFKAKEARAARKLINVKSVNVGQVQVYYKGNRNRSEGHRDIGRTGVDFGGWAESVAGGGSTDDNREAFSDALTHDYDNGSGFSAACAVDHMETFEE